MGSLWAFQRRLNAGNPDNVGQIFFEVPPNKDGEKEPEPWIIICQYIIDPQSPPATFSGVLPRITGLANGISGIKYKSFAGSQIIPVLGGAYNVWGSRINVDLTLVSGLDDITVQVMGVRGSHVSPDNQPVPSDGSIEQLPEFACAVTGEPANQTVNVQDLLGNVIQTLVLTDYNNFAPLDPRAAFIQGPVPMLFNCKCKNYFG